MVERISSGFHPFVIPFMIGMCFVLTWCVIGAIRIIWQLPAKDRKKFFLSLINPKILLKDIKDIFCDCLLHVKLWKRNKVLGFMHSSIAFGWFMIIVLGHIEVMFYLPDRLHTLYYPIFFNYFVAENNATIGGMVFFFLMDLFLALIISGIVLAMIKRVHSRLFGMRRTTRLSLLDNIGLYSLWAIFPLRLLAEGFTAHISGGSFLTIPLNWLARAFMGNDLNMLPTWWAYSISLCVFMCVLPFTRYMHIPAEMLLIPMRNAGIKIRHSRKGFSKLMVYSCPSCGVCIDACPMSVKKSNLKYSTVYLNRHIRRSNEKQIEEISDKCLLCGKCSQVCQIGVDGPKIRIAQRARRHYGIRPDYSGISPTAVSSCEGKVLYFAGCMTHLTPRISKAVESVLQKAGIDYEFMDKNGGLCCGRPLMTAGLKEQAKELIEKNVRLIKESGCTTLLLSCPICYKIFSEKYKLEGIKVVHHSVYFKELLDAGKICSVSPHLDEKLVYHDPCELGRGCNIYDEPRQLLSSFGQLVEAEKSGKESICCGGSLGSLSLNFAQREDLTKNALRNLTVADPERIVTACPLCLATFSRYADRVVEDIAEIIDKRSICNKN